MTLDPWLDLGPDGEMSGCSLCFPLSLGLARASIDTWLSWAVEPNYRDAMHGVAE